MVERLFRALLGRGWLLSHNAVRSGEHKEKRFQEEQNLTAHSKPCESR